MAAIEQPDHCALCERHAELRRSHIVPKFAHASIFSAAGGRRKATLFKPSDLSRTRVMQDGFKERLLCADCEHLINERYEKPFKAYWYGSSHRPTRLDRTSVDRVETLMVPRPAEFTLFHLSVLLRAHLARNRQFEVVQLGPRHESRLRELVLGRASLEDGEYPVSCQALQDVASTGVWHELVGPPMPRRVLKTRAYEFMFAGCSWFYFVSSHVPREVHQVSMQADGRLPVLRRSLDSIVRGLRSQLRQPLTPRFSFEIGPDVYARDS